MDDLQVESQTSSNYYPKNHGEHCHRRLKPAFQQILSHSMHPIEPTNPPGRGDHRQLRLQRQERARAQVVPEVLPGKLSAG